MNHRLVTFVCVSSLVVGGCGKRKKDDAPPTAAVKPVVKAPPVAMTWDQLDALTPADVEAADVKGDDKAVIIDGYLSLPHTIFATSDHTRANLFARPIQSRGFVADVEFHTGAGPHQMEPLPASYSTADFKVHADNGDILGDGGFARITGRITHRSTDSISNDVTIEVDKVEKLPAKDADYSTATEFDGDKAASFENKLVRTTGALVPPTMLLRSRDNLTFDLTGPKPPTGGNLRAIIAIGAGVDHMDDVPPNFTAADIKIRDHVGKPVSLGSKVTLYGMYYGAGSFGPDGYIQVEKITAP